MLSFLHFFCSGLDMHACQAPYEYRKCKTVNTLGFEIPGLSSEIIGTGMALFSTFLLNHLAVHAACAAFVVTFIMLYRYHLAPDQSKGAEAEVQELRTTLGCSPKCDCALHFVMFALSGLQMGGSLFAFCACGVLVALPR